MATIRNIRTDAQVIDHGFHATNNTAWYVVTMTDTRGHGDTLAQFKTHADAFAWATQEADGMGYAYTTVMIE